MSKFVGQIGNTWIGTGTKRRKDRKGRRWPAKNLVHRSQHPNGNRDSHSFPHVVVCEYGPFMLLIVRSKYSRVAIIMNERNNHVCYVYVNLYNTVYKLRVKYRIRINTFLFNLMLSIMKKENIFINYSRFMRKRERKL